MQSQDRFPDRVSPEHTEVLWTVSSAARFLSISESYLRHLVLRKGVPGIVRIGRAVRFDPESLRNFVRERMQNG